MKMLIVDDTEGMVAFIRQFLKKKGHEVDEAYDGKGAITMIQNKNYDFIFMDYKIPDLTGINIIEYLRETGHKEVKIIMMTGDPTIKDFRAFAAGADYFLQKPISIKEIDKIISA